MKYSRAIRQFCTLATLIALPASAYVVDADPANFAAGTELTEAFEGSSIHEAGWGLRTDYMHPVYATDCVGSCDEPTNGLRVFSSSGLAADWNPTFNHIEQFRSELVKGYSQGQDVLLAQFDQGTSFVEVTGQSANDTAWYVDVWGTDGSLLTSCRNDGPINGNSDLCSHTNVTGLYGVNLAFIKDIWTVSIQREGSDIGFISVGGFVGPSYVQKIAYSVPEPTPLLLVSAGVIGFGFARRRSAT